MARDIKTTSAHRRAPRNSLSPATILDAAEKLMARPPHDLSIRDIAREVQSSPMALYRHFPNKEALLNSLLDRVLLRFKWETTTDSWVIDLQRFAFAHKQLLDEHPWAVSLLISHPSPGLGATRIGEIAFSILQRGNITGVRAVSIFSGIIALNYGWTSFTKAKSATQDDPTRRSVLLKQMNDLKPSDYPLTTELATELENYGSVSHYDIAMTTFCLSLIGSTPS